MAQAGCPVTQLVRLLTLSQGIEAAALVKFSLILFLLFLFHNVIVYFQSQPKTCFFYVFTLTFLECSDVFLVYPENVPYPFFFSIQKSWPVYRRNQRLISCFMHFFRCDCCIIFYITFITCEQTSISRPTVFGICDENCFTVNWNTLFLICLIVGKRYSVVGPFSMEFCDIHCRVSGSVKFSYQCTRTYPCITQL